MEHSQELDQLAKDLSQLQSKLTHVSKDSKGYGYNYSSLPDTLDVAKPLLAEFGFSVSQFEDGNRNLVTLLLHKSGQWLKGRMTLIDIEMKGTNAAQNKGSVLSYFRRYSLQAILGMAAEDTDAVTKDQGNKNPPASIRSQPPLSSSAPKAPEIKIEAPASTFVEAPAPVVTGSVAPARKSFRTKIN